MVRYNKGHSNSTDSNEPEIIKYISPHVKYVENGMHDIIIYKNDGSIKHQEIKSIMPVRKCGTLYSIQDTQYKILCHANDSFAIVWTKEQSLNHINEIPDNYILPSFFREHYKKLLSRNELNRLRKKTWWNLQ